MLVTAALLLLAGLAYLGRSLVMLASVGGLAVGLWIADRRTLRGRMSGAFIGGLGASLLAEAIHLVYHRYRGDVPDHGGFWLSAVLVGLINVAAVFPIVWVAHRRRSGSSQDRCTPGPLVT